eukprot:jgi/Botrbrau1/9219/Bobra.0028s0015.1
MYLVTRVSFLFTTWMLHIGNGMLCFMEKKQEYSWRVQQSGILVGVAACDAYLQSSDVTSSCTGRYKNKLRTLHDLKRAIAIRVLTSGVDGGTPYGSKFTDLWLALVGMFPRRSFDRRPVDEGLSPRPSRKKSLPLEHVLSEVNSGAWQQDEDIKRNSHTSAGNKYLNLLKLAYGDCWCCLRGHWHISIICNIILHSLLTHHQRTLWGVVSLILWTLTAVLVIKYTLIVLHADDHGQGGEVLTKL